MIRAAKAIVKSNVKKLCPLLQRDILVPRIEHRRRSRNNVLTLAKNFVEGKLGSELELELSKPNPHPACLCIDYVAAYLNIILKENFNFSPLPLKKSRTTKRTTFTTYAAEKQNNDDGKDKANGSSNMKNDKASNGNGRENNGKDSEADG
ncbi:hypothetical protein Leryth_021527 [Lithospermum erythrorhizon]|nr:hypothetical protein Leryth_021527 [Lithospermum erythrorhizon]